MHCKKCKLYQVSKTDTQNLAGLYQPLAMLQMPKKQVYINFVVKLPEDDGYGTTITCIDYLNKIIALVTLQESDAWTVARRFLAEVMSNNRPPATIITYRNPKFQGNFLEELMKKLSTSLLLSTTTHLQMDRMAEVTYHTIE